MSRATRHAAVAAAAAQPSRSQTQGHTADGALKEDVTYQISQLERHAEEADSAGDDLGAIHDLALVLQLRCGDLGSTTDFSSMNIARALETATNLSQRCNKAAVMRYKEQQDYDTATSLLNFALQLTEEGTAPLSEVPLVRAELRSTTISNFGCMEHHRGNSRMAMGLLEQAVAESPESPVALINLSAVQNQMGAHELAGHSAKRAASILERRRGNGPSTCAATGDEWDGEWLSAAYHNLAMALESQDARACFSAYDKAIQTAVHELGREHEATWQIWRNLLEYAAKHGLTDSIRKKYSHMTPIQPPVAAGLPAASRQVMPPSAALVRAPVVQKSAALVSTGESGRSHPVTLSGHQRDMMQAPETRWAVEAHPFSFLAPRHHSLSKRSSTILPSLGGASTLPHRVKTVPNPKRSESHHTAAAMEAKSRPRRLPATLEMPRTAKLAAASSQSAAVNPTFAAAPRQRQSKEPVAPADSHRGLKPIGGPRAHEGRTRRDTAHDTPSRSKPAAGPRRSRHSSPETPLREGAPRSTISSAHTPAVPRGGVPPSDKKDRSTDCAKTKAPSTSGSTRPSTAATAELLRLTASKPKQPAPERSSPSAEAAVTTVSSAIGPSRKPWTAAPMQLLNLRTADDGAGPWESSGASPATRVATASASRPADPRAIGGRNSAPAARPAAPQVSAANGGVKQDPARGQRHSEATSSAKATATASPSHTKPKLLASRKDTLSSFKTRGQNLSQLQQGPAARRGKSSLSPAGAGSPQNASSNTEAHAIVLQRHVRGFLARQAYQRRRWAIKHSVVFERIRYFLAINVIQKAMSLFRRRRAAQLRSRIAKARIFAQQSEAATVIQCLARRWLARRMLQRCREEHKIRCVTAIILQRWVRRCRALQKERSLRAERLRQQRLTAQRECESRAATIIQSQWRGFAVRALIIDGGRAWKASFAERIQKKRCAAALCIQRTWRGMPARRLYRNLQTQLKEYRARLEYFERRLAATLALQSFARMLPVWLAAREQLEAMRSLRVKEQEKYSEAHRSATQIQCAYRQHIARMQLCQRRKQRAALVRNRSGERFVGLWQRIGRGWAARRRLHNQLEKLRRAGAEHQRMAEQSRYVTECESAEWLEELQQLFFRTEEQRRHLLTGQEESRRNSLQLVGRRALDAILESERLEKERCYERENARERQHWKDRKIFWKEMLSVRQRAQEYLLRSHAAQLVALGELWQASMAEVEEAMWQAERERHFQQAKAEEHLLLEEALKVERAARKKSLELDAQKVARRMLMCEQKAAYRLKMMLALHGISGDGDGDGDCASQCAPLSRAPEEQVMDKLAASYVWRGCVPLTRQQPLSPRVLRAARLVTRVGKGYTSRLYTQRLRRVLEAFHDERIRVELAADRIPFTLIQVGSSSHPSAHIKDNWNMEHLSQLTTWFPPDAGAAAVTAPPAGAELTMPDGLLCETESVPSPATGASSPAADVESEVREVQAMGAISRFIRLVRPAVRELQRRKRAAVAQRRQEEAEERVGAAGTLGPAAAVERLAGFLSMIRARRIRNARQVQVRNATRRSEAGHILTRFARRVISVAARTSRKGQVVKYLASEDARHAAAEVIQRVARGWIASAERKRRAAAVAQYLEVDRRVEALLFDSACIIQRAYLQFRARQLAALQRSNRRAYWGQLANDRESATLSDVADDSGSGSLDSPSESPSFLTEGSGSETVQSSHVSTPRESAPDTATQPSYSGDSYTQSSDPSYEDLGEEAEESPLTLNGGEQLDFLIHTAAALIQQATRRWLARRQLATLRNNRQSRHAQYTSEGEAQDGNFSEDCTVSSVSSTTEQLRDADEDDYFA